MTLLLITVLAVLAVSAACSLTEAAIYASRLPYIRTLSDSGVLAGRLSDIKASYGESTINLEYEGPPKALQGLAGVREVRDSGRTASLLLDTPDASQEVLRQLVDRVRVRAFELAEPSVEDIFLDKVGYVAAAIDGEQEEVLQ